MTTMTEGDWNLVVKMIESRLENMAVYTETRNAVVSPKWLAATLVDHERLRQQVTEVQARNSELEVRNRALAEDAELARKAVECAERMCADARAEVALHRTVHQQCETYIAEGIALLDVIGADEVPADAARRLVKERDEARAALASVTASRDALAEAAKLARQTHDEMVEALRVASAKRDESLTSVPVELVRLFKAAKMSLEKHGVPVQVQKVAEECGELVAELCRTGDRFDQERAAHELHDVLTVALSLCEPALMAKAAERLEGRLGK